MKIYVETPARLHMGLVDLSGSMGRMFGGLGAAINHPNVVLEAESSEKLSINGKEKELVTSLAKKFFETYKTKNNVSVNLKQAIPAHVGLGSGTQLSLALATALSKILNVKASTQELALAMGRARRTGVGTAVFEKGGFVVDGGKKINNGTPVAESFPPLVFRQPIPNDWRFIVVIPNIKKGLTSQEETSAFNKLTPMKAENAAKMCHLTMMKLIPAIAEHDIKNFGEALTNIQIITGNYFAQVQGGTYSSPASAECLEFMRSAGAYGVGQSSWGPALYGVVTKAQAKKIFLQVQDYLQSGVGGQIFIAKGANKGAKIKVST
jgi:beta-ribofuranosylaminobenzene 5'-phosphate synthase